VPAFWLALIGLPSVIGVPLDGYRPGVRVVMLLIIAAMVIPVVFRRKYPVHGFAIAAVAGALQLIVFPQPVGSDLAILLLLYTLAAYRRAGCRSPGWPYA